MPQISCIKDTTIIIENKKKRIKKKSIENLESIVILNRYLLSQKDG